MRGWGKVGDGFVMKSTAENWSISPSKELVSYRRSDGAIPVQVNNQTLRSQLSLTIIVHVTNFMTCILIQSPSYLSKVDEYGFERSEGFDYIAYESFMSQYLPILARRSKKWTNYMASGRILQKKQNLKSAIRKGIPNEFREKVSFINNWIEII